MPHNSPGENKRKTQATPLLCNQRQKMRQFVPLYLTSQKNTYYCLHKGTREHGFFLNFFLRKDNVVLSVRSALLY
ncbi:hypothetical protein SAMN06298226_2576 [Nitrosovibrio sp. Nv4]|nr:hypothetical protein SAMN06298226_2576 [Nitrosovibrio sp. Nv4]